MIVFELISYNNIKVSSVYVNVLNLLFNKKAYF